MILRSSLHWRFCSSWNHFTELRATIRGQQKKPFRKLPKTDPWGSWQKKKKRKEKKRKWKQCQICAKGNLRHFSWEFSSFFFSPFLVKEGERNSETSKLCHCQAKQSEVGTWRSSFARSLACPLGCLLCSNTTTTIQVSTRYVTRSFARRFSRITCSHWSLHSHYFSLALKSMRKLKLGI